MRPPQRGPHVRVWSSKKDSRPSSPPGLPPWACAGQPFTRPRWSCGGGLAQMPAPAAGGSVCLGSAILVSEGGSKTQQSGLGTVHFVPGSGLTLLPAVTPSSSPRKCITSSQFLDEKTKAQPVCSLFRAHLSGHYSCLRRSLRQLLGQVT